MNKYVVRDERGNAVAKIEKHHYYKIIGNVDVEHETIDTSIGKLNITKINSDSYLTDSGIFIYLWKDFYIHKETS